MRILLFGHRGQLGSALMNALPASHSLISPDIDITDDVQLRNIIISTLPDIIINAAAYTNVDGAETESERAFAVNTYAPRLMAKLAKENNIRLVHYSTDYVFDGTGNRPWNERDLPHPMNIYGQSKWEGEQYIIESGCQHLIFRTSWVYGAGHKNFITQIIQMAKVKDEIKVISNQIGAPTSARFLAESTYHAIQQESGHGLYHLCCAGETSWYHYAQKIISCFVPQSGCRIIPVTSDLYAQKAQRPLNSRLNCNRFINDFGLSPPDWEAEFMLNKHLF
ncbi:MAG TPA: dTDP-4-dehydrorhamnose reductase [Rhodospirillaceae bacterium]|nr:dTDP-4-dehydrorhamnose reductase [Rhodospirillaceae bacterium]